MKPIKIALGTTSKWKIKFVKKVLDEMGIIFKIVPVKSNSEVSDQPLTEKETILGSINRAKQALKKIPDSDIGLGIEVGYDKKKTTYEMFCFATVAEKDGTLISSCSHRFPLPELYQNVLKNDKKMHKHLKEYYKKDDHPATQYLAKMIDKREPFIIEAVRGAILKFFRKEEFQQQSGIKKCNSRNVV